MSPQTRCQCGCAPRPVVIRRSFFKSLGAALGAALGGALLWPASAWAKKVAIKLERLAQLTRPGGWSIVKIKGREILLIRDTSSSVRALSSRCTHKNTRLQYQHDKGWIQCPQHGSRFSLEGKVLKGPARRALHPLYQARLDLAKKRIIIELP